MKTKQEAIQEQIDEIMDTFDFDDVHQIMVHRNWTWGSDEGVPSKVEIRVAARERMKDATKTGFSSTGGFTAILQDCPDGDDGPFVRMTLYFGLSTYNDGTGYTV